MLAPLYPKKHIKKRTKKKTTMPYAYPTFHLSDTLSPNQYEFFREKGFIHFKNFLATHEVEAIIKASEDVQRAWLADGVEKINGVPIKYGKDVDGKPIVQRFAFINQHASLLANILTDERIQALRFFIGFDARIGTHEKDGMVFNHYINSEHSKFTKMGWHTDGLRDIFLGKKLNPMLNIGLHLNTQTIENGGLRIIPGTHRQNLFQFLFRKKYFLDNNPDKNEVAILPEAGDLTVHDGRLWHRVAQSSLRGEASRRRVIYFPIIAGEYKPKTEESATPFYQRLAWVVK
ncbi:MAG: phytanoyl-CoA dioxygenase family protein [Arachidicoccus sp.]|nr:phytanoyl-CoA dioxygenase family protein [Arachidicoccus sp.]